MIKEIIFAFLATLGFGITFEIRGKKLFFSCIVGSIGWVSYILSLKLGYSLILSYFIASIILTICSEILARILKTPVTSILINGLIPLVPGGGIYYTMYFILQKNMEQALFKGAETFLIAGALSFGIVVVSSLVRIAETGRKNRYFRSLKN